MSEFIRVLIGGALYSRERRPGLSRLEDWAWQIQGGVWRHAAKFIQSRRTERSADRVKHYSQAALILAVGALLAGFLPNPVDSLVLIVAFILGLQKIIHARWTRLRPCTHLVEWDPRAPVYWGRSFTHDGLKVPSPFLFGLIREWETLEQAVTDSAWDVGSVVTLANNTAPLQGAGAARSEGRPENWQRLAFPLIDSSQLLIILIGSTAGVQEEVRQFLTTHPAHRILFVNPPPLVVDSDTELLVRSPETFLSWAFGSAVTRSERGCPTAVSEVAWAPIPEALAFGFDPQGELWSISSVVVTSTAFRLAVQIGTTIQLGTVMPDRPNEEWAHVSQGFAKSVTVNA